MVCSFFASLSLFSEVNTRSDTSEVRKSKEPVRPPSTLSPSYKALVSFVYLGRQVTQFCRNVLLSNDLAVLERYRPEARIPAWIRPDTITAAIVTPCHDRGLLRLRDFAPITRDENMTLVKRAITSRRYLPVRWSIISGMLLKRWGRRISFNYLKFVEWFLIIYKIYRNVIKLDYSTEFHYIII